VVFDFQLGRGRDGPKKFLGGFNGILQTDGYAAYDKVGGPKLVHGACWTHARRKFYEAHQLCPGESVAKGIVLLIDDLFGIDAPILAAVAPEIVRGVALDRRAPDSYALATLAAQAAGCAEDAGSAEDDDGRVTAQARGTLLRADEPRSAVQESLHRAPEVRQLFQAIRRYRHPTGPGRPPPWPCSSGYSAASRGCSFGSSVGRCPTTCQDWTRWVRR